MIDHGGAHLRPPCSIPAASMIPTLRLLAMVVSATLSAACGSEQAVTFTGLEPPDPASVRLFVNGADYTDHLALNTGFTQEVEVRLYAANGVRIRGYDDHFTLAVQFTPLTLVNAAAVAGRPLFLAMTSTAAPDSPGSVSVTVSHPHAMSVRTFGPFEVVIH